MKSARCRVARRLAGCCALVVFAFCLIQGLAAHNSFSTTVMRALLAMLGTFVLGLIIGWVAERMLDENLKAEETKLAKKQSEGVVDDR
jgi:NhaP-type Na+/H+ or K+/H+ antiporter